MNFEFKTIKLIVKSTDNSPFILYLFHFLEKNNKITNSLYEALVTMKFENFIVSGTLNILILIEVLKILTNFNYFLLREHKYQVF